MDNALLQIWQNSPEYSQELPSLQRAQEAPEGPVCQEVQQVQQYQLVPSHQETPRKVQNIKIVPITTGIH